MKHDSFDTNADDEPGYVDDDSQQDNETATFGAQFIKEKHGRTADHTTVAANQLDADLLPVPESEQEQIEVRRGKTAEDDEEHEPELPRSVAPAIVKQRNKQNLTAALADFGKLPKVPKEPANDNFRPTVSWPLMDQLTRSTFEPDRERRAKMAVSARYILEIIDIAFADQVGASVYLPGKSSATDHDVQRTESGEVHFEHGQALDRRKVTIDNEDRDERFIGSARTAKKSLPVGGFDPYRDDSFPVRRLKARETLAAIAEAVGPLWPHLLATMIQNYSMTDIGEALGVKSAQASIVGTAHIRFALNCAMEALERINGVDDEPQQRKLPMPDKSRGSFRNQSRNHVVKVAA
jgi:hypothetical protein